MARKDFIPEKPSRGPMLISRETVKLLKRISKMREIEMNEQQFEKIERGEKVIYTYKIPNLTESPRPGGGGSIGPFCKIFFVTEGETRTIYLLGGVVSGGAGNFTIADIELADVGSEPSDGTFLWLEVSFTAYVEDDVLLPGGDVTAVSENSGASVPDNVIPTVASPSGTVHVVLGQWSQGFFEPSACGNILVSHCLGELTHNHY